MNEDQTRANNSDRPAWPAWNDQNQDDVVAHAAGEAAWEVAWDGRDAAWHARAGAGEGQEQGDVVAHSAGEAAWEAKDAAWEAKDAAAWESKDATWDGDDS
jgi:hypothetical protein